VVNVAIRVTLPLSDATRVWLATVVLVVVSTRFTVPSVTVPDELVTVTGKETELPVSDVKAGFGEPALSVVVVATLGPVTLNVRLQVNTVGAAPSAWSTANKFQVPFRPVTHVEVDEQKVFANVPLPVGQDGVPGLLGLQGFVPLPATVYPEPPGPGEGKMSFVTSYAAGL